jgi:hypothetical protein
LRDLWVELFPEDKILLSHWVARAEEWSRRADLKLTLPITPLNPKCLLIQAVSHFEDCYEGCYEVSFPAAMQPPDDPSSDGSASALKADIILNPC